MFLLLDHIIQLEIPFYFQEHLELTHRPIAHNSYFPLLSRHFLIVLQSSKAVIVSHKVSFML